MESAKLQPEGRGSAWEPLCFSGTAGAGSSRLTGDSCDHVKKGAVDMGEVTGAGGRQPPPGVGERFRLGR